jgi:hypothetical protein
VPPTRFRRSSLILTLLLTAALTACREEPYQQFVAAEPTGTLLEAES